MGFEKPMISHLGYEKPMKLSNCHFIGVEMPMIFHINSKSHMKSFGAMYFIGLEIPMFTCGTCIAHALYKAAAS